MKKQIISLYDYTGEAVKPWAEAGYECFCYDIQHDAKKTWNTVKLSQVVGSYYQQLRWICKRPMERTEKVFGYYTVHFLNC